MSADVANVVRMHEAVVAHSRATGHTVFLLDDDIGRRMVGVSCAKCPSGDARWFAPRPGLISQCTHEVKEVWESYRTLEGRRQLLARLVEGALQDRVPKRSVWSWLRSPGV